MGSLHAYAYSTQASVFRFIPQTRHSVHHPENKEKWTQTRDSNPQTHDPEHSVLAIPPPIMKSESQQSTTTKHSEIVIMCVQSTLGTCLEVAENITHTIKHVKVN